MSDNLRMVADFQADLKTWSRVLDRELADVVRTVTLQLYQEITLRNPVDTGYSRANWNIAQGAPDTTVSGIRPQSNFKAIPKRTQEQFNAPARRRTGGDVISAREADMPEIDGQQTVFITNSLPYIQFLEDGSSTQAPSGFVRIALAVVEAKVDSMIAQARSEGFE